MKTEVFLRKDKIFKSVYITDNKEDIIQGDLLDKWQRILNITANLIDVPAALLMKITEEYMTVTLSNENEMNLYPPGDSESLGAGLYCETVIGENKELYVKNALNDAIWENNPDIKLDMISYYGFPVNWPDGSAYGTLCILDQSEINLTEPYKDLLREFKNVIEEDLSTLLRKEQFKTFFEVNLDLLCITNLKGDFIKVNKAWENLLNISVDSLEKMNFFDLLHSDDFQATYDIMDRLLKGKEIKDFVNRYKDQEGNYHFIEWNSNIHLEGKYIYASARDITKQKNQADELIYQEEFQVMMSDISLDLLTINSLNIDEIINNALNRIKYFFKTHRGYIFKYEKGLANFSDIFIKLMHRIYEIVEENIEANNKLVELNKKLEDEIAAKNTYEIAFLKSQIKPHFLYNTLSTLVNLCYRKPEIACLFIEKLADFLKYNYEISPTNDYSTFKKELEQIDLYMSIQKERFQERIHFETIYNKNVLDYKIPHLMLQPLIENALFHGILKKVEGGRIILEIKECSNTIEITVYDNGVGFNKSTEINEENSSGIGLANINKRLKFMFNEELEIKSKRGKTVIKFKLPKLIDNISNERI